MKLKTLKDDFEEIYSSFEYKMDTYDDELRVQKGMQHALNKARERAIKWVKENIIKETDLWSQGRNMGVMKMAEFLDISEDDLKSLRHQKLNEKELNEKEREK